MLAVYERGIIIALTNIVVLLSTIVVCAHHYRTSKSAVSKQENVVILILADIISECEVLHAHWLIKLLLYI